MAHIKLAIAGHVQLGYVNRDYSLLGLPVSRMLVPSRFTPVLP